MWKNEERRRQCQWNAMIRSSLHLAPAPAIYSIIHVYHLKLDRHYIRRHIRVCEENKWNVAAESTNILDLLQIKGNLLLKLDLKLWHKYRHDFHIHKWEWAGADNPLAKVVKWYVEDTEEWKFQRREDNSRWWRIDGQ